MDPLLLAYLTFTFVLVVTPGATTAVVVRNALIGGRSAGLAAAAGAAVANTSHAMAAGLGLAVVFARWPAGLTAIRIGGAGYLAWLGLKSLYRVLTERDGGLRMVNPGGPEGSATPGHGGSFRQGLTVNLLNPPIITFYLVLPTFLPAGAGAAAYGVLAAIHVIMAFVVHVAWSVSFATLRALLTRPLARRLMDTVAGVAMLAFSMWTLSKLWSV